MKPNQATKPDEISGRTDSLWMADIPETGYPPLSGDMTCDVAVIGGGIVGLTAALLLNRSGARVVVLEAGRIATGVSGHTTAKITLAHGLIYSELIRWFHEENARRYAQANQAGLDFIFSYIKEHAVACDFQRTFACTYTRQDTRRKSMEDEVQAAKKLGLPVSFTENLPLPFAVAGAIRFENQAFFHPRKYLLHMAETLRSENGIIFENTRVIGVQEASPCRLTTVGGRIKADQVIVATHFPILNRGLFFMKMAPFRSYLAAFMTRTEPPEGMYYSSDRPTHTLRKHVSDSGQTLLLLGGENHDVGHESDTIRRYLNIEAFARKHFDAESVSHRWSTQDNRPADRLPFIGHHSPHSKRLFVATGFQGWGMTNGTAAGLILTDMISGRSNPWQAAFDPGRTTPYITPKFVSRNLHVAGTFIKDRLTGAKRRPVDALAPGQGAIAEKDGKGVAAFRDRQGGLHLVSPFCVHMGCRLTWNNAEQSWDCPCHGSRFRYDGSVVHAPAKSDLKQEDQ